jgi:hypothetical protein
MKDYGRGKGAVYMRWVKPSDLPQPKGSGIQHGRPSTEPAPPNEGELEDFDASELGYDWEELQAASRGGGGVPPLKVRVNPRGKIELADGNHRLAWWLEQDMDAVPVYVIDERKKPGYAKGGKVKASAARTAMDELKEYANALAPQRGMFSTLDELVQQAPFERAPVDQWRGFLQPSRMLKRNGMQFPLKKEELQYALEGPLRTTFGTDGPPASLTKEQLLEAIRTQRPEFHLGFATDSDKGARTIEQLEALGDINTLAPGDRRLLEEGYTLRNLGTNRVQAYNPAYSPSQYEDARLSHVSPNSEYAESITNLKGLAHPSHFAQNTLSWSRTSQHDVPDLGKVRLVEEIQSDLHEKAAERTGDFKSQHGLRQGLKDAGLWEKYRSIELQEADLYRQRGALSTKLFDRVLTPQEERATNKERDEIEPLLIQLGQERQELVNQAYDARPRRGYRSQEMLDDLKRQHETVRGEMNASVSGDSREYQTHDEKLSQAQDLVRRMGVEEEKPPDAPFKDPKEYGRLELRKQLVNAAKNGEDYLAIVRGQDQMERYGMGEDDESAGGMQFIYDKLYRSELESLARQYGTEVRDIKMPVGSSKDRRPEWMREAEYETPADFYNSWKFTTPVHPGDIDTEQIEALESTAKLVDPGGMDHEFLWDTISNWKRDHGSPSYGKGDLTDRWNDIINYMSEEIGYQLDNGSRSEVLNEPKTFPALVLTPEVRQKILDTGVPVWSAAAGAMLLGGHDDEAQAEEPKFAEGGEVDYPGRELAEHIAGPDRPPPVARRKLSSLQDLVKHLGHGFATQWTGLDPSGKPQSAIYSDWDAPKDQWEFNSEAQQYLPPARTVRPGIVDETIALPDLLTFGHGPDASAAASERSQALDVALRAQEGIGDPAGVEDYAAEALGTMFAQVPVPGGVGKAVTERALGPLARMLPEAPALLKKLGKIPGAAVEWFSPTIEPSLGNYLTGTAAGTALTMGLPKATEAVLEHMDRDNPWRVAKRGVEAWEAATPEERERRHLLPPDILIELAQREQPMDLDDEESAEPDEDDQAMIANLLGGSDAE